MQVLLNLLLISVGKANDPKVFGAILKLISSIKNQSNKLALPILLHEGRKDEEQEVLDEISGATIHLLSKMAEIYVSQFDEDRRKNKAKISREVPKIMNKFKKSKIPFKHNTDIEIYRNFYDIRKKIRSKNVDLP